MSKVDFSSLNLYSEKDVDEFNKEVENFVGKKSKEISIEAVSYFYLTLHKLEEKRRGLTLEEAYGIIRGLQGKMLTLIEASFPDREQRKAMKDIISSYCSHAQSMAQDYDWGRYDNCSNEEAKEYGYLRK